MIRLYAPVVLSFASTLLLLSCGSGSGSGSTATAAASCAKACDKLSTLCFADAGVFGDAAKTTCSSSCTSKTTSTSTSTCANPSATLAAYQACVDRVDTTCDQFESCLAAVPACGGGGTGGSSGGGTGGSSGGTGGVFGFDGGIPGFDGSIPGLDGGFSGTCADLLTCCNAMTDAQSKAACMSLYTSYMALGDSVCAIAVTSYKTAAMCP